MLHLRRPALSRLATSLPFPSKSPPWTVLVDRLIAADPGLLRLMMATRGTLAVLLMTLAAIPLGRLLGAPPIDFAAGITFSLMAPFLTREPTRRQRQRTLLFLALPAIAAAIATTILHGRGTIGDSFFLALVFICFLFQARSPQAIGLGLVAVVVSYVGLYLELPPNTLPTQILSILVALPVTALACFVLVPIRPAKTLRRTSQSVGHRAALALQHATPLLHPSPSPTHIARFQRSLARLNEAALAADDQIALIDPAGAPQWRHHLMHLELAIARLATTGLASTTPPQPGRLIPQLQSHQDNLRSGQWSPTQPTPPTHNTPLDEALAAIAQAATALTTLTVQTTPTTPASPPTPTPPGPLAWRIAFRVTLAAALAMAGGMALSPQRWFWAVITTYVVFLGTRSRGDTIYKGIQRIAGTLLGLVAGLVIATALANDPIAETIALLGAIFGMYYFFLVSYTLGIFCVTVLLGLLYSLLGAPLEPLLVLRLEETAIGAAATILVAAFVFPVRTRDHVRQSGRALLTALARAVAASADTLAGAPAAPPPIARMRNVDRQVADLRLALLPLSAGRAIRRRSSLERPIPALLDAVHWTRVLSLAAATPDEPAAALAKHLESRLAALADGHPPPPNPLPALPPTTPARTALDNLDQATQTLSDRLDIGALQGFTLDP